MKFFSSSVNIVVCEVKVRRIATLAAAAQNIYIVCKLTCPGLKLAPLLAQYLYTNKRLDLPGIGNFLLDPAVIIEQHGGKHGKPANMEGVSFENNPAIKDASGLIDFISKETGKMKALAMADLDSYLELAHQFLNIGKPFLIEGVGSLVKIKSGQFAFTSGQIIPEMIKEYSAREISSTSSTEESFADFKNASLKKAKSKWKKPITLLLLLIGIGVAIWGGYTVYKKTTGDNNNLTEPDKDKPEDFVQLVDTTATIKDSNTLVKDSVAIPKDNVQLQIQKAPAGNYKFVVEVANKERGLNRFSALKSWGLNIKMETIDSTKYKLFFVLPASATDTTRIKDSIGNLYTPYWQKAFVEN